MDNFKIKHYKDNNLLEIILVKDGKECNPYRNLFILGIKHPRVNYSTDCITAKELQAQLKDKIGQTIPIITV